MSYHIFTRTPHHAGIAVEVERVRGAEGRIVIEVGIHAGSVGISWSGTAALSIAGTQSFVEALQAAQEIARQMEAERV